MEKVVTYNRRNAQRDRGKYDTSHRYWKSALMVDRLIPSRRQVIP